MKRRAIKNWIRALVCFVVALWIWGILLSGSSHPEHRTATEVRQAEQRAEERINFARETRELEVKAGVISR